MDATLEVTVTGNAVGFQPGARERAEMEVEIARQELVTAYENLDRVTGGSSPAFEAWSTWEAEQLAYEAWSTWEAEQLAYELACARS